MNRAAFRLIAVFLLIIGLACPASAQTTKTAWEKQIGTDCNNGSASADFDTLAQCSATSGSGTFQKAPLFVGQVTSPPYASTACDAAKAGMLQYTGGVVQYCNGSAWNTMGSGGSSGTSSMNIVTASRSFATVYQNSTGSSLFVVVSAANTSAMGNSMYANVAATSSGLPSSSIATSTVNMVSFPNAGFAADLSFLVPPGYYYNVTTDGGAISIQKWTEWTFSLAGLSSYLGSAATTTNPSRADDITTGLFSATASTVSLATGGVERLRVTATGSVGIGTTAPAYPLDSSGTARFQSEALVGYVNGSSGGLYLAKPSNYGIPAIQGVTSSFGGNQNIALNPVGGNVGIGTTTPSERLDLGGGNIKMGYEYKYCNFAAAASGWLSCACPSGKRVLGASCRNTTSGSPLGFDLIDFTNGLADTGASCLKTGTAEPAFMVITCANIR